MRHFLFFFAALVALPTAASGTPLYFELKTTIHEVPGALADRLSTEDIVTLRFRIRLDAEDALAQQTNASLFPLGLVKPELRVGDFLATGPWGSFLIQDPRPFINRTPIVLFQSGSSPHDFFFGRYKDGLGLTGFSILATELDANVMSAEPASLLDLPAAKLVLQLRFRDARTNEEHAITAASPGRLRIAVPGAPICTHLTLAALGFAGLWRAGRRPFARSFRPHAN